MTKRFLPLLALLAYQGFAADPPHRAVAVI